MPLVLEELTTLIEPLEELENPDSVQEIVSSCASFLTIRENTVYFIHHSAKDFISANMGPDIEMAHDGAAHGPGFVDDEELREIDEAREDAALPILSFGFPGDEHCRTHQKNQHPHRTWRS